MASKLSFDDAIAAATRAHVSRSRPVSSRSVPSARPAAHSVAPPLRFGGSEDDTVGNTLARWQREAHHAPSFGAASRPVSATTSPRGEIRHAHPAPSSAYIPPTGTAVRYAASAADIDATAREDFTRQITHNASRMAALEAEEGQLAADELALQARLMRCEETKAEIEEALQAIPDQWNSLYESERSMRFEPVVDLSVDISQAEGVVEALRERHDEMVARYDLVHSQLAVVEEVERHKQQQLEELSTLESTFKDLAVRRAQLVQWCQKQQAVEAVRERTVSQAVGLLNAAEMVVGASFPTVAPPPQPSVPTALPPALKGTRSGLASRASSVASARLQVLQQPTSAALSRVDENADEVRAVSRSRSSSHCVLPAQKRTQHASATVDPFIADARERSGVSFALDLDGEDSGDYSGVMPPTMDADDLGGLSLAIPSAASVLTNSKRLRTETSVTA